MKEFNRISSLKLISKGGQFMAVLSTGPISNTSVGGNKDSKY